MRLLPRALLVLLVLYSGAVATELLDEPDTHPVPTPNTANLPEPVVITPTSQTRRLRGEALEAKKKNKSKGAGAVKKGATKKGATKKGAQKKRTSKKSAKSDDDEVDEFTFKVVDCGSKKAQGGRATTKKGKQSAGKKATKEKKPKRLLVENSIEVREAKKAKGGGVKKVKAAGTNAAAVDVCDAVPVKKSKKGSPKAAKKTKNAATKTKKKRV